MMKSASLMISNLAISKTVVISLQALHDPVDFRSKKHNFTIGLENSKHKSRTLSKYRAYLINAVKSIEMRFIRKGQIPPGM